MTQCDYSLTFGAIAGYTVSANSEGIGRLPGQTTESVRTTKTESQDSDLVRRAKDGDVAAFGQLVRLHERTVYGVVSRMVRSKDEVDDLAQEIFLQAWRSIGKFRGDSRFSTWLHTIAVNATLKKLEWLRRRESVSLDDPDTGLWEQIPNSSSGTPFDQVCSSEQKAAVGRAIDSLSDHHRLAVVLHYFEDMPCYEIAEIMNCSVGTVWSRLHYACKKLKDELTDLQLIVEKAPY